MQSPCDSQTIHPDDAEIFFDPPLWRQRRALITDILKKHKITSVIDFGCGEGNILSFLIPVTDDEAVITRLVGVDVSHDALKLAAMQCRPWEQDYKKLREAPLSIDIYQGSVDRADSRLLGFDALVCTEVVEHLHTPVLSKFHEVVLGTYRPRVVVVTTPNAEFNIYFPQLKYGTPESVMRNDDHKFEWTRAEFEEWCRASAAEYNYSLSFTGVGSLKHADPNVGRCTQVAVFTNLNPESPPRHNSFTDEYELVEHINFPYYDAPRASSEAALERVHYYMKYFIPEERTENERPHVVEIQDLWNVLEIRQVCKTREWLLEVLAGCEEFEVEEKNMRVKVWREYDDQRSVANDESNEEQEMDEEDEEKDWDQPVEAEVERDWEEGHDVWMSERQTWVDMDDDSLWTVPWKEEEPDDEWGRLTMSGDVW
ncbi:hypothetical protein BC937DRAFT_90974 [Endogone sp. FLAS-F59071]|nr:hypothetical protein BC937DRAFT_90974 [Endogone sp. FLAS-F59071]|eukprot:RUS16635.1 hypothetical protein BC937DRAFT_90974 [Endogone sp. FLAS-F59071]